MREKPERRRQRQSVHRTTNDKTPTLGWYRPPMTQIVSGHKLVSPDCSYSLSSSVRRSSRLRAILRTVVVCIHAKTNYGLEQSSLPPPHKRTHQWSTIPQFVNDDLKSMTLYCTSTSKEQLPRSGWFFKDRRKIETNYEWKSLATKRPNENSYWIDKSCTNKHCMQRFTTKRRKSKRCVMTQSMWRLRSSEVLLTSKPVSKHVQIIQIDSKQGKSGNAFEIHYNIPLTALIRLCSRLFPVGTIVRRHQYYSSVFLSFSFRFTASVTTSRQV